MPKNANGLLFAICGSGGGVTCYIKDGYLNYEYNGFIIEKTKIKSSKKLPAGATKIEVLLEPTEGFEVGRDEHAPVSSEYFDNGHFPFNGTIHNMNVKYLSQ